MAKPRDFALTFGGAGIQEVRAEGRYLYVLATPSADCFFELDRSGELERGAGQAIFDADGFSIVRVRSTVAQTVKFSVSLDAQADARSNVALNVSATVAPGADFDNGGDVAVPATSSAQVLAADANRLSALIINPPTNTETVRVGISGVAAASGIPLAPGESVELALTAAIFVYNPGAAPQTVSAAAVRTP